MVRGDGPEPPPPPLRTPLAWRIALLAAVAALGGAAWLLGLGELARAAVGVFCFLGLGAAFSADLRRVNWRTVALGFGLQVLLAVFILRLDIGASAFKAAGDAAKGLLAFSDKGAEFVFGPLAQHQKMAGVFGPDHGFVFAFRALPTIIFLSAFFTVLYHFGVLQWIVKAMAWLMVRVMGTSGAETLSVSANVFLGQTEAPLMVKPYVPRMTRSELLTLMIGGMAHISGALMAVYIGMGADAVAILATSVMAVPASLYLGKLLLPETETPETLGTARTDEKSPHSNAIDAASAGASDGLHLALNIAAMLIAFIALVAMLDAGLKALHPSLSLQNLFGALFSPVAFLIGTPVEDVPKLADLLGQKLVINEFFAYSTLQKEYLGTISPRGLVLASFALTGFANFASIGIQLGGIGGMAPTRRSDIARLGGTALFAGFLATLINASLAGVLDSRE
ncbi:MAG: Na+ dependent nucleoside transporter domain protein [Gemmataceae bacterium]|nr:Na+ dependent nucleoside transporter domain protein [Gemmataceae bacterium]